MPKLSQPTTPATKVEFVTSVPLDLMNAMYFTSLVEQTEGIEGWPVEVRKQMSPELLGELDFLFTFPKGQPGIMGALTDRLLVHPKPLPDVDALVRFVGSLPLGVGESPNQPGIQGLAFYTVCSPFGDDEQEIEPGSHSRKALVAALEKAGVDVDAVLATYDRPEELRARMVSLIEGFYDKHYRHDMSRRLASLERSVAVNRNRPVGDINELARRLTGRPSSCLETVCEGPYSRLIFVPSLDMGPYVSCANIPPIHGLFYPCEAEFIGEAPEEAATTQRLARVYKALGDEQRLRILQMLFEREMYAQEIVERTGLHQSAVSRHLAFMQAVGLLTVRREANMKFFSPNPDLREELRRTLDVFGAGAAG
jgi:DNA-binding transcriptional ArsR family regulator